MTEKPELYIYYEGNDLETLQFIKELQEAVNVHSKVMIYCTEPIKFKLKNCTYTDSIFDTWTSYSPCNKCIRIINSEYGLEGTLAMLEYGFAENESFEILDLSLCD